MTCVVCNQPTFERIEPKAGLSAMVLYSRLEDQAYAQIESNRPVDLVADRILKTELLKVGLNLADLGKDVLWRHRPNNSCGMQMVEQLSRSFGYQTILLIGHDLADNLIGHSITKVNGLVYPSHYYTTGVWIPCISPGSLVSGRGLGELRFALSIFADQIKSTSGVKHDTGRRKRSRA